MKTVLSKIISFIVAAVVLCAGLVTVPNPDPENLIPTRQIESDSDGNENGGENQAEPQCDEPIDHEDVTLQ